MKLSKSLANCRAIRRYLLIFTAVSLLLLPLSLAYLVWNEQLQKIRGFEVSAGEVPRCHNAEVPPGSGSGCRVQ